MMKPIMKNIKVGDKVKQTNQYIQIMEKYELNEKVNKKLLSTNGFSKNGVFKCYVYKDILQLIIKINMDENWWDFQVFNMDSQMIYHPYYVKNGNTHREVNEIESKIKKIINKLVDAHILMKRRKEL